MVYFNHCNKIIKGIGGHKTRPPLCINTKRTYLVKREITSLHPTYPLTIRRQLFDFVWLYLLSVSHCIRLAVGVSLSFFYLYFRTSYTVVFTWFAGLLDGASAHSAVIPFSNLFENMKHKKDNSSSVQHMRLGIADLPRSPHFY